MLSTRSWRDGPLVWLVLAGLVAGVAAALPRLRSPEAPAADAAPPEASLRFETM